MYFVYVLCSLKNNYFYIGMTNDLQRRIYEHNSGQTKSTKGFIPWKLVYHEEVKDRMEARKREKYLKSGVGKEFIKKNWPRSSTE